MGEKINVIIIDKEENTRNILKNYLVDITDIGMVAEFADMDNGFEFALGETESLVLLDLSDNLEKSIKTIERIRENSKNTVVIGMTNKPSTDVMVRVLRAGARDVITKPVTKTVFCEVVGNAKVECGSSSKDKSCKVISTFSNKGGIGKTSISVNMAVDLAQLTNEKVALIDLNLQLGDVATFLDMTPMFAMDYIASNIKNLDEAELLKTLSRYKNTSLYVVADPLNPDKSKEITAEQIQLLIETLKKMFSYIVIDIGTNIDSKTTMALNMSDVILLVSIVNLPAIRNTQRCLELFEKLGYSKDKIKLVLNRYMENEEIKTIDIEETLKHKVYWKIPNNYLTMMSAINKGVPVQAINSESNIAKNYMEFATRLSDYLIAQKINQSYKSQDVNC